MFGDAVKYFLEFFFGKSPNTVAKLTLGVVIIIAVIFVNHTLGFANNYYNQRRLDNLEKVKSLLAGQDTNSSHGKRLLAIQEELSTDNRFITDRQHSKRFWSWSYFLSYGVLLILFGIFAIINPGDTGASNRFVSAFWSSLIIILAIFVLGVFAWFFAYIPSNAISFLLNLVLQILFLFAIYYMSLRINIKK